MSASTAPAPKLASRDTWRRQPNLLANGSFEEGEGPRPAAWLQSGGTDSTGVWSGRAQERALVGHYAMRVVLEAPGEVVWRQLVAGIDPSIRYRLGAYVFASNTNTGSHGVALQWLDADGQVLVQTDLAATQANAWSELTRHNLVPPPDAAAAWILLRASQPGEFHFDRVVLTRQDESIHAAGAPLPLSVYDLSSPNLVTDSEMEIRRGSRDVRALKGLQSVCTAPDRCEFPAFWNTWVESGEATQLWERVGPRDHVLLTVMATSGQADWRQLIPDIDPTLRYRLSAKLFASDAHAGSHAVEVHWRDVAGHTLGRSTLTATSSGSWSWPSVGGLTPPPGTASAWLLLRAYLPGTYRFDNVRLDVDLTNGDRLKELRQAGFTLASAYGTEPRAGFPSLDEVGAAGLKAVYKGVDLLETSEGDAARIQAAVSSVARHPALSIWMGKDEPAWYPVMCPLAASGSKEICPELMVTAYERLRQADGEWDRAGHRVWMNHAPRGTALVPDGFSLLTSFNPGADILSMDVYPVPAGNGHVSLSNDSVSSVGAYTNILYEQVAQERGRQVKPIWMVLQAFAWSDYPSWTWHDSADTRMAHAGATLEVHWLDASGSEVQQVGSDGVARQVIALLQSDRPNTWRSLTEQTLQPPPEARTARILLRTYEAGLYWFDDLEFSQHGGANLLTNASFEEGGGRGPTGWLPHAAAGIATLTWDDTFARSGRRSARTEMHRSGLAEWRQDVAIDPTRRYRLGGTLFAKLRPDWKQTRFMAYDAILRGARGLAWWGNHYMPYNAELWRDVKRVVGELAVLGDAVMAPPPLRDVTVGRTDGAEGGEAALFQQGEQLYLVAANASSQRATFRLHVSGPALLQAERRFESGPVTLEGNSLTDTFEPFQVHVYQLR